MSEEIVFSSDHVGLLLTSLEAIAAKTDSGGAFEIFIAIAALFVTALLGAITIRQQNISKRQFDILTATNEIANKQQRILMIENNLDVLQRLNEIALSSPENLEAAFTSVNRTNDSTVKYNEKAARKVFFHYLRINRMYRAWLLKDNELMKQEEYDLIVNNYAGTLKRAQTQMKLLSKRGYDDRFIEEIDALITDADPIDPIVLEDELV